MEKKFVEVALVLVLFVEERSLIVEDAVEISPAVLNVCNAVHTFALPRLSPIVRAVAPVYVPLKVREALVALRLARVTYALVMVVQVGVPVAEIAVTALFVHAEPRYGVTPPVALAR